MARSQQNIQQERAICNFEYKWRSDHKHCNEESVSSLLQNSTVAGYVAKTLIATKYLFYEDDDDFLMLIGVV